MKKFFANRIVFAAILFLFASAMTWNLAQGGAAFLGTHLFAPPAAVQIAHGPIPPPPDNPASGGLLLAHGPIPPPPDNPASGGLLLAHGPIPPPPDNPPSGGLLLAHA